MDEVYDFTNFSVQMFNKRDLNIQEKMNLLKNIQDKCLFFSGKEIEMEEASEENKETPKEKMMMSKINYEVEGDSREYVLTENFQLNEYTEPIAVKHVLN